MNKNRQLFAARERLLHLLAKQQPVRQIGQRVVPGHVHDLGFGLLPLGHVFIGCHPTAVRCRIVSASDDLARSQLIEMRSLGGPAKRVGEVSEQILYRSSALALGRHLQFEHLLERGTRLDLVPRQSEDLEEAAVHNLKPMLGVEQAQPLRHVVERGIEPPVGLPQARFLLLRQCDVAAHDDEALIASGAMADAQPAPVGKQYFAGCLRIAVAPGQDAAGADRIFKGRVQIGERRARL